MRDGDSTNKSPCQGGAGISSHCLIQATPRYLLQYVSMGLKEPSQPTLYRLRMNGWNRLHLADREPFAASAASLPAMRPKTAPFVNPAPPG